MLKDEKGKHTSHLPSCIFTKIHHSKDHKDSQLENMWICIYYNVRVLIDSKFYTGYSSIVTSLKWTYYKYMGDGYNISETKHDTKNVTTDITITSIVLIIP